MSILFGVRKSAARPVQLDEMERLAHATAKYALDGIEMKVTGQLGMAVQPYYTHRRSRLGSMIAADELGNRVSLDGRLDNVKALCEDLHINSERVSDAEVVLRSFLAYGEVAFSRFVGDWAVALWHEQEHVLYLARDHAGTRTLYYEVTEDGVLWGTYLESFFVGAEQRNLRLSYVATFLTSQTTHLLTPYEGIHVVPPAHFVAIDEHESVRKQSHWGWMRGEFLLYKNQKDYEEHFLELFGRAVERRTEHDDLPILAELSGGMDSSSIVCMCDTVRRKKGMGSEDLIDTVSYYDAEEPNWDELPFVAYVEEQRGKIGTHLSFPLFSADFGPLKPAPLFPGTNRALVDNYEKLEPLIEGTGCRVVLAGHGGDELLGGVPTPLPQLADDLVRLRLRRFAADSFEWCLPNRTPLVHLVRDTAIFAKDQYWIGCRRRKYLPPESTALLSQALQAYEQETAFTNRRTWIAPSRVANGIGWWNILDRLPHQRPIAPVRREYRYPLLDRDLVEFLYSVPRHVLLRPGRRRSMMRDAMCGIVPTDVLERRRKGVRSGSVLRVLSQAQDEIRKLLETSTICDCGLMDRRSLSGMYQSFQRQETGSRPSFVRILLFDLWARDARSQGRLTLRAC